MSNNVVLNITISLVFIYLLYSLLATILMEFLALLLDLRSRMLVKSIKVMLEDRYVWSQKHDNKLVCFLLSPAERLLRSLWASVYRIIDPFPKKTLAKAFYQHPNIKYLSESIWNNRPSYISANKFSETVAYILRGNDYDGSIAEMEAVGKILLNDKPSIEIDNNYIPISKETLQQLKLIYYDSKGDSSRFRQLLENWFNEMSQRTSGWYKKQTQFYLLILGFFIAFQFNVDTLSIYNVLAKNDTAYMTLANLASKAPDKYDKAIDSINKQNNKLFKNDELTNVKETSEKSSINYLASVYKSLASDAQNSNLVMGLGKPYCEKIIDIGIKIKKAKSEKKDTIRLYNERLFYQNEVKNLRYNHQQKGGFHTLVGWLITALAMSLGAPFWFDLLGKLVNIRNAGPQQSDEKNISQKENVSAKNRVG